ncbi:MAG: glycosyltransferase family 4 protein [Candidatus Omnitrophica bacterium]|nr:glycosyltransferase family 4 protein [Candidatus Omnitrophota bacterium]
MKIALLVSQLPSRCKHGPAYQMHYLANHLVQRGHEITVFSMDPKPDDALYNVRIVKVKDRFKIFRYMWALSRIDYSAFDVLHASGDDALLFLSKNKPPHVRTFMGSSLSEAFHMFKQPKQCLKTFVLAFFEYISIFVADKCVLISKGTRRFIPFVRDVVYCGVDTNRFKPGNEKSDNPSILFVGTLGWRKRGNMLVEIFNKQIKTKIPNAELWLVADRDAKGEGIANYSKVSTEKLIELYQKAWVFCLPSTYEGFGLPYAEAMACGTPIVASPNLGAKEVLGNGKYGIVANDNRLLDALLGLLQNEELRKEYAQKGLDRAEEFDFSKITTEYENLYYAFTNNSK